MRKSAAVPCLVLAVVLLSIVVLSGCGGSSEVATPAVTTSPGDTGDLSNGNTVPGSQYNGETEIATKAEYEQVKEGMTYDQVTQIIGGEGRVLKEVQKSNGVTTTIYHWNGNGGPASFAQISFEGGKVVSMLQSGLQ